MVTEPQPGGTPVATPHALHPDNLAEACDILREIGAQGILLVRGAIAPGLSVAFPGQDDPAYLAIEDAGVLLIARLPSDSGEPGIETR